MLNATVLNVGHDLWRIEFTTACATSSERIVENYLQR